MPNSQPNRTHTQAQTHAQVAATYVTLANAIANTEKHTPMIQHFLKMKAEYKNELLFYRMGDFYELFFDDAILAAELLGITLTRRGKDFQGLEIPMAGVPYHAAEGYLARLVAMGKTVAICEQVGEVTGKANTPMQREVVRILTPGTLTDDALMDSERSQCVVAIATDMHKPLHAGSHFGIAMLNLSAGKLVIHEATGQEALAHSLARIAPAEIILHEDFHLPDCDYLHSTQTPVTMRPSVDFSVANAQATLCQQLEVSQLAGFGEQISHMAYAQAAAAALIHYANATQKCSLPHIKSIQTQAENAFLVLDTATRKNLEILTPQFAHGTSLLKLVNHCQSALGKRELAYQLARPLASAKKANARLHTVNALIDAENTAALVSDIRHSLASMADVERITGRIALKSARPRDLKRLCESCQLAPSLVSGIEQVLAVHENGQQPADADSQHLPQIAQSLAPQNAAIGDIADLLARAIIDNPPVLIRDGGVIATGFDAELDELRSIRDDIQENLQRLEAEEKARSGMASLKIGYNKVSGFFFELSRSQSQQAPAHFIRRQTLKNSERFITDELKSYEDKVLSSEARALEREKQLYAGLLESLCQHLKPLQAFSDAVAQLDVFTNWAYIAIRFGWHKPSLHTGIGINIIAGRHPVIEQTQKVSFTANDTLLDSNDRLMLITGPNMGGKSTFMRQTAIICILAYCGSYVPAASASIGEIDRIFTRIGSADDVSTGRSTFMVEMIETAQILHQATPRSLALMDEVGRGTSTYDGLALAWAMVLELAQSIGCMTLFATHYFELTALAAEADGNHIRNFHVDATEIDGELLLLHQVKAGAASKSYGLHVAALAGVPAPVVAKAKAQLAYLDSKTHAQAKQPMLDTQQYDLFTKNQQTHSQNQQEMALLKAKLATLENALVSLNPDDMTPKQALNNLYQLKELLK